MSLEKRVAAQSADVALTKGVQKPDSMAVLLTQGLQSDDQEILEVSCNFIRSVVEWIERLLLYTRNGRSGLIPGRGKPKIIKIGIYSFPA